MVLSHQQYPYIIMEVGIKKMEIADRSWTQHTIIICITLNLNYNIYIYSWSQIQLILNLVMEVERISQQLQQTKTNSKLIINSNIPLEYSRPKKLSLQRHFCSK